MIGELCPASQACRQMLERTREKQRGKNLIFYRIIEIGGATNFVVDQLLKTRGGENVLAMAAMTLPIMPSDAFVNTFGAIFEESGVPVDNQPGRSQLLRLRSAIETFSRASELKDKIYNKSIFFQKSLALLDCDTVMRPNISGDEYMSTYEVIPDAVTIAKAVLCFSKVLKDPKDKIIVWNGHVGASWFAVYSQEVLGLEGYEVRVKGKSTLLGKQGDTRVLIDLDSKDKTCELQYQLQAQDFFSIHTLPKSQRSGWMVDMNEVEYIARFCPSLEKPGRMIMNDLAPSLLEALVDWFIDHCSSESFLSDRHRNRSEVPEGFERYCRHFEGRFHARARANLQLFGIRCAQSTTGKSDKRSTRKWYDYMYTNDKLVGAKQRRARSQYLMPRLRWIQDFGTAYVKDCPSGCLVQDQPGHYHFNDEGLRLVECLWRASYTSALLSLTNWGLYYRGLSLNYLDTLHGFDEPAIFNSGASFLLDDADIGGLNFSVAQLAGNILVMTTDAIDLDRSDFVDEHRSRIACSHDGLVIVKTMALQDEQTLQRGIFLGLFPGIVLVDGEVKDTITSVSEDDPSDPYCLTYDRSEEGLKSFFDPMPGLKLDTHASTQRANVNVKTKIFLGSIYVRTLDSIAIAKAIPDLLVSLPCEHGYEHEWEGEVQVLQGWYERGIHANGGKTNDPLVLSGLFFGKVKQLEPDRKVVCYQSFDGNRLGQWVACQWSAETQNSMKVLQSQTCIKCCIDRADKQEICLIPWNHNPPRASSDFQTRGPRRQRVPVPTTFEAMDL